MWKHLALQNTVGGWLWILENKERKNFITFLWFLSVSNKHVAGYMVNIQTVIKLNIENKIQLKQFELSSSPNNMLIAEKK